jgi:hypothetical protein
LLLHDVKLPCGSFAGRVESYEIAPASIRRNDDVAFVCDCRMPPGIEGEILRHYSFPDRWWSANIGLRLDGSLRANTFGPAREFPYDCDITSPHFEAFDGLCNIDLKLDVFIRADGRDHVVVDHDDFDVCIASGWIDGYDRAGAEGGLSELVGLIESGSFVEFLLDVCPLASMDDVPEVTILPTRPLAEVPALDHWRRVRP